MSLQADIDSISDFPLVEGSDDRIEENDLQAALKLSLNDAPEISPSSSVSSSSPPIPVTQLVSPFGPKSNAPTFANIVYPSNWGNKCKSDLNGVSFKDALKGPKSQPPMDLSKNVVVKTSKSKGKQYVLLSSTTTQRRNK